MHSSQLEHGAFLSARDKVVDYVPKVRVDVILEDDRAKAVLDEIRNSKFHLKAKGCTGLLKSKNLESCN